MLIRDAHGWTGERVQRLRRCRGLTQQALAELLGVGASTISRWETEEQTPSRLAARRLEDVERGAER